MAEQPENQPTDVPAEAPDANLRATIDGLDNLTNILEQALADDDALVAKREEGQSSE